MKRKINICAILITLLCMMAVSFAADAPDFTKTGSIIIHLTDDNTGDDIPGGEIEVLKVCDIDTSVPKYVYTDLFAECPVDVSTFDQVDFASEVLKYAEVAGINGDTFEIADNGMVKVDSLELGIYLVKQNIACDGYFPFNTFVVSVPLEINDEWVYDVNANPKMDPIKAMTPTPTEVPETPTPTVTEVPKTPTPTSTDISGGTVTPTITEVPVETPTPTVTEVPKTPTPIVTLTPSESPTPSPVITPDDPTPSLPQTGQLLWPVPILGGGGAILFLIGFILFRKKEDKDEA